MARGARGSSAAPQASPRPRDDQEEGRICLELVSVWSRALCAEKSFSKTSNFLNKQKIKIWTVQKLTQVKTCRGHQP